MVRLGVERECEAMVGVYVGEMALTEHCLRGNPKSYACWEHRRWCLVRSEALGWLAGLCVYLWVLGF